MSEEQGEKVEDMKMSEEQDEKVEDSKMSKEQDEKVEDAKMSEEQDEKVEEDANKSEEQDEKMEVSVKPKEDEDDRIYRVLVNREEQYAIWLADLEIPKGWESVGPTDKKDVCLAYVKEVWTDMRPKSLR